MQWADPKVGSLLSSFGCVICHELPWEAVHCGGECKCSAVFCMACLVQWMSKNETCPGCRAKVPPKSTARLLHPMMRDLLGDQVVCCVLAGCGAHLKVREMENHLHHTCPEYHVNCPHCITASTSVAVFVPPDRALMPRKELAAHEEKCPYKQISCELCSMPIYRKVLEEHNQKQCPAAIINCPHASGAPADEEGCPWKGRRDELPKHLADDCYGHPLPCIYTQIGCTSTGTRKQMDEHLKSFQGIHLQMAMQRIRELTRMPYEKSIAPDF